MHPNFETHLRIFFDVRDISVWANATLKYPALGKLTVDVEFALPGSVTGVVAGLESESSDIIESAVGQGNAVYLGSLVTEILGVVTVRQLLAVLSPACYK